MTDFFATFAALTGRTLADSEGEDSENFLPVLLSLRDTTRQQLITGTRPTHLAVRQGDWKYVKHIGFDSELFNISKDPNETTDLIKEKTNIAQQLDQVLTGNFDCEGIDARAKQYDKESFIAWRKKAKAGGTYHDTMARVYSGYDRLCIEDIAPWADESEQQLEAWLTK